MKRTLLRLLVPILLLALLLGCAPAETPETAPTVPTQPAQTTEPATEPATEPPAPAEELLPGYTAVIYTQYGFLAVGTGGRLDMIAEDGTVTALDSGTAADLTEVWTDGTYIFVSGREGTLLVSRNGKTFAPVKFETDADVCGAVRFDDEFYAATSDGVIYRSANMEQWEVVEAYSFGLTHFISMDYGMAAINAETDVLFTIDGLFWDHQNFNEVYEGLYPEYVFTKLIGAGETFFVLGYERDEPRQYLTMFTETCEVWMLKSFNEIDGVVPELDDFWRLNDLEFCEDQIVAACTDGRLLTIPECSVCNKTYALAQPKDLTGIALSEAGNVIAVGEDFYYEIVDSTKLRQDHIQAAQARKDVEEKGAVIIDVRNISELEEEGFIPGSLNIPLSEVEETLYDYVPNPTTEIIFYCKAGSRAQSAVEIALSLGYSNVYNLGGLKDWPYEIDHFEDQPTEP